MKLTIEIPKEFEEDFRHDKFKGFFLRVKTDIRYGLRHEEPNLCGNYELETAEMFEKAIKESDDKYRWHYTADNDYPQLMEVDCVVPSVQPIKNRVEVQFADGSIVTAWRVRRKTSGNVWVGMANGTHARQLKGKVIRWREIEPIGFPMTEKMKGEES